MTMNDDAKEIGLAKTKDSARAKRLPVVAAKEEIASDKALVSKILYELIEERNKPKVKTDDELVERINDYFNRCAAQGRIPVIEEMAISCGYTSSDLADIERGISSGTGKNCPKILKKAREMLKSFDAKLVISGKMNFLAYCFRAKNYYGMVDKQEYIVTPNVKQETDFDAEDIKQRYMIEGGKLTLTDK